MRTIIHAALMMSAVAIASPVLADDIIDELEDAIARYEAGDIAGALEAVTLAEAWLLEKQAELTERVGEAAAQLGRASEAVSTERAARSGESDRLDALMEKRQTLALDVQRAQMAAQGLLQGLLEEFATRDGTDYGEQERSLASKVAELRRLLDRGEARIVFDPAAESVNIVVA